MAEPMSAAELIVIIQSHPGACEMLELNIHDLCDGRQVVWLRRNWPLFGSQTVGNALSDAECWLVGAAVERLLQLGIELPKQVSDGWRCYLHAKAIPFSDTGQTSFLHAALAALESHAKEVGQ